jgi:elongation factor P
VKPGKGNAFTRTKLKNMLTGSVLERTFKSGETFGVPEMMSRDMQFLYKEGDDQYAFMDTENYEQTSLNKDTLGDDANWLKENTVVSVLFYQNRPLSVDMPNFVELVKPATLETGAVVNVPLFLNEGDVIKIDTRSGEYSERVNK